MKLKMISINKIKPNPLQPREHFDREKIEELADSIKEVGLLNPIQVRPKHKEYEIIAGERRWKACQVAGIKTIPIIIKDVDNGRLMVESLIENVHREDLDDTAKAKALKTIMERGDVKSVRDLAKIVGLTYTAISDIFDSADMREELEGPSKKVSQSVISETRGLEKEERKKIIKMAAEKDIGGRRVRKLISVYKKAPEHIREKLARGELEPEIVEKFIEKPEMEPRIFEDIDTGVVFTCPVCKKKCRILHCEPSKTHIIEES